MKASPRIFLAPKIRWPEQVRAAVSVRQPLAKRRRANADVPRPLGERLRPSFMFQHDAEPAIRRLLLRQGPAAVSRLIPPVVVDSIDAVSGRRAGANVISKVNVARGSTPLLADENTTPAVVRVRGAFGVVATLEHAPPRLVQAGVPFAVHCVAGDARGHQLGSQAPTGCGRPSFQIGGIEGSLVSAGAPTKPTCLPASGVLGAAKNGEPAELLARQIVKWHATKIAPSATTRAKKSPEEFR